MSRPRRKTAPKGATGERRNRRPPRGRAWAGPFRRANRALASSLRLITRSVRQLAVWKTCGRDRPAGASRVLRTISVQLFAASRRLGRADEQLAKAQRCVGWEPEALETDPDLPELLEETAEGWEWARGWLDEVASELIALSLDLCDGLADGTVVPERRRDPRRRIVLRPRPVAMRAFLARRRRSRVADRIASILERRRRTPRPAAVRVPQRHIQGRAPPVSPICLL